MDNYELEKVDEAHESTGEKLLEFSPVAEKPKSQSSKHSCPKCQQIVMQRFYFSLKKEVEIDDCPNCGGTWLDAGELARLRSEYKTEQERKDAAQEFFFKLFDKDLRAIASKSQADLERSQRFVKALKYVLPSYWVPGKQKGGAF